jgi:hypothetical protein
MPYVSIIHCLPSLFKTTVSSQQILLSGLGIAQLPGLSEFLRLSPPRSSVGESLAVTRTVKRLGIGTFPRLKPTCTRSLLPWFFTLFTPESRCAEPLWSLRLTHLKLGPRFRGPLVRLATRSPKPNKLQLQY